MRLIYWLTMPYYEWRWRRHRRVVCIVPGCWRVNGDADPFRCDRHA